LGGFGVDRQPRAPAVVRRYAEIGEKVGIDHGPPRAGAGRATALSREPSLPEKAAVPERAGGCRGGATSAAKIAAGKPLPPGSLVQKPLLRGDASFGAGGRGISKMR